MYNYWHLWSKLTVEEVCRCIYQKRFAVWSWTSRTIFPIACLRGQWLCGNYIRYSPFLKCYRICKYTQVLSFTWLFLKSQWCPHSRCRIALFNTMLTQYRQRLISTQFSNSIKIIFVVTFIIIFFKSKIIDNRRWHRGHGVGRYS